MTLLRDVLGRRITIENAVRERSEGEPVQVSWWGGAFRRFLRTLAKVTGFAVRNAYENAQRGDERQAEVRQRQEGRRRGRASPGG